MSKIKNRLIALMVITSATAFGSINVYAFNPVNQKIILDKNFTNNRETDDNNDLKIRIKEKLDELVKEGTITQAEADETYKVVLESKGKIDLSKIPLNVRTALHKKLHKREGKTLNLTDEQLTKMRQTMEQNFKIALNSLIANGTITTAQADSILQGKKGLGENKFTEEQKTAIFTAIDEAKNKTLDMLVKDGTITKEQAEEIRNTKRK